MFDLLEGILSFQRGLPLKTPEGRAVMRQGSLHHIYFSCGKAEDPGLCHSRFIPVCVCPRAPLLLTILFCWDHTTGDAVEDQLQKPPNEKANNVIQYFYLYRAV